jgi:FKBP-type peptidyl-prolyl cis-trans isomerase
MKSYCALLIALIAVNCTNQKKSTGSGEKKEEMIKTASGLQYIILKKGSGPAAKEGQEVLIFETTSYQNGNVLYTNEGTSNPVKVLIGGNQATTAVDEGLRGMQVGEVRKLIALPHLVKRTNYPDNVSPDSTLVLKIILHKIL